MSVTILAKDLDVQFKVFTHSNYSAVEALSKGAFKRKRMIVDALTDINFEVQSGQALGLIGHNGAGKTTLLRAIAGVIPPARGKMLVSSQPQMLGAPTKPLLSGRANVELGLLGLGFHPSEIDDLAPGIIEFTELGDFIDLPFRTYSAGMRQRLRFAVSTAVAPDILLLDEALAVGDHHFREKSLERLNEIKHNAGTVVLASHNMFEIRRTCDIVLWLRDGRILAAGGADEVVEKYHLEDTSMRDTIHKPGA